MKHETLKKSVRTTAFIAASIAALAVPAYADGDQPDISIVINQSPWLDSFISVVDRYEEETGNKIELDVTPFGGLLEKIRNSVRADVGTYDIVNVNALWLTEIYAGGFLSPLTDIRDGYTLAEGVLDYGATTHWNHETNSFDTSADLMGIPLNGNVQVLYYRSDLYEEAGLSAPTTWDELAANAAALHEPPSTYGFVPRAARNAVVYNFTPYLYSQGGSVFEDPASGNFNVTINSPEALTALETYLHLTSEVAPENPGAIAQGELIQLLATGKAAQAIAVIGAWGNLENPDKSAVVGLINAALIPSGPGGSASAAGHWVGGIPNNISDERQEAAMAFLDWFVSQDVQIGYVEAGGVPIRGDLAETSIGSDDRFRFIEAYGQNAANAVMALPLKEGAQVSDALALRLNQAVIGEISATDALNAMAADTLKILTDAGYEVTSLSDL